MKKYKLTNETIEYKGKKLYRIKALIDFGNVEKGARGGFVEKEENLSMSGNAWVCGDALVCGGAFVYGAAKVCGNALVDKSINYAVIKGFGTCCRPTTFFRCQDKTVKVSCGCFLGTIDEFRNQVKNTRGGKIAKEYLMIADLMELHFSEDRYDD